VTRCSKQSPVVGVLCQAHAQAAGPPAPLSRAPTTPFGKGCCRRRGQLRWPYNRGFWPCASGWPMVALVFYCTAAHSRGPARPRLHTPAPFGFCEARAARCGPCRDVTGSLQDHGTDNPVSAGAGSDQLRPARDPLNRIFAWGEPSMQNCPEHGVRQIGRSVIDTKAANDDHPSP